MKRMGTRPRSLCVSLRIASVCTDVNSGSFLSVDRLSLLRKCLKSDPQNARSRQAKCWKLVEFSSSKSRELKARIYELEFSWVPNELLIWLGQRNSVPSWSFFLFLSFFLVEITLISSGSCLSVDRLSLLRKYLKGDPQFARSRQDKCWKLVVCFSSSSANSKLEFTSFSFLEYQTSYWFDWDREILSHLGWDKLKLDWRTDTTLLRVVSVRPST